MSFEDIIDYNNNSIIYMYIYIYISFLTEKNFNVKL